MFARPTRGSTGPRHGHGTVDHECQLRLQRRGFFLPHRRGAGHGAGRVLRCGGRCGGRRGGRFGIGEQAQSVSFQFGLLFLDKTTVP